MDFEQLREETSEFADKPFEDYRVTDLAYVISDLVRCCEAFHRLRLNGTPGDLGAWTPSTLADALELQVELEGV